MPRVSITVPERKSQPYRFALDRKTVTLGRGSENDIVIDCGSVSVRHAVMERVSGGYELRDLGSTNGTKLGGKRLDIVPLHDGISVNIGDVAFDFALSPEEIEEIAKESPADDDKPKLPELKEEPVAKPVPPPAPAASTGGGGGLAVFGFIIAAALAFFIGMSVRHQNDTGRGLVRDMKNPPPAASEASQLPETPPLEETSPAE